MRVPTHSESVKRAVVATAGLLQATIAAAPFPADAPEWTVVRESDLQIAFAQSLQAQVGARVRREASIAGKIPMLTKGRYGPIDVAILSNDLTRGVVYVETKWCAEDKLAEILWDAVKLAQLLACSASQECFFVCGAPSAVWDRRRQNPVELFDSTEHRTTDLLGAHDRAWNTCLRGGGARPAALPAVFSTAQGPAIPIHLDSSSEDWTLRATQILVDGEVDWLTMNAEGWPEETH